MEVLQPNQRQELEGGISGGGCSKNKKSTIGIVGGAASCALVSSLVFMMISSFGAWMLVDERMMIGWIRADKAVQLKAI